MGSLPPQGAGSGSGGGGGSLSSVIVSGENENFTVTASYTNALVVDLQQTSDHVITIVNTDGSIDMDYKIYASADVSVSAPADGDDSWFNVLNPNSPDTYDHDLEKSLPATKKAGEGISNRYSWLRIQLKADSGTPTAKIWVRGTNL